MRPSLRIYTAGYGGRMPADLARLAEERDATVYDIRLSARSQRAEWNGGALARLLGRRYRHLPELGNVNYKNGGEILLKDTDRGYPLLLSCPTPAAILLCGCPGFYGCHRELVAVQLLAHYQIATEEIEFWGDAAAAPGFVRLPAISLWQPWASLVALGHKRFETRGWGTTYRGPILIHATKQFPPEGRDLAVSQPCAGTLYDAGYRTLRDLPLGAALAIARITGCYRTPGWDEETVAHSLPDGGTLILPPPQPERGYGDYSAERFAFALGDVAPLPEPFPMPGVRRFALVDFPAALLPPAFGGDSLTALPDPPSPKKRGDRRNLAFDF